MIQTLRNHPGRWLFVAAIIVTTAIYTSGLSGSWLFDDYPNIVNNPGVQIHSASIPDLARAALSSPSSEFKRPLASLTFALNYLASGLNPFWWKVANVAIHLANGLLIFLLARLLLRLGLPVIHRAGTARHEGVDGGQGPSCANEDSNGKSCQPHAHDVDKQYIGIVAALIAGAWMLLPINLTGVLYVVQRMESLANLFVMLGLLGYVATRLRMLDGRLGYWRGLTGCTISLLVFTALGLTAKETAIMLPLYAFLIEFVLLRFARPAARQGFDKSLAGLYGLILLLPLLAGLAWQLPHLLRASAWSTRDFDLGTRLLSEARIVSDYIRWTLLPTPGDLSFYHDGYVISSGLLSPWTTLPSILVIAALLALTVWLRKRAPLASLGLALYFGCHTLTGTILPLELIYEHRNYFASFGLLLAIIPILAAPKATREPIPEKAADDRDIPQPIANPSHPTGLPLALPRHTLLVGLLLLWTGLTAITAYAWGEPLRLAQTLAARATDSPRAQYELGRTYIVYSHYDPDSIYTKRAYAPLERSAALPQSSILAEQALIFMNARMHLPIKDQWWNSMIAKLKAHKPGVQDESSLGALTKCAREGTCKLPENRMVAAFLAALDHPRPRPRLLAIYGDYAWNVLDDHTLGARMITEAVKAKPEEPAYHITLTRMLAAQERYDEARQQIRALEKLNIGGRLDGSIAGLRALLPAN